MLSQIIFFVAVALLVVFLLTRSVMARSAQKAGDSSGKRRLLFKLPNVNLAGIASSASGAWSAFASAFSKIKMPKMSVAIPGSVKLSKKASGKDDHVFWHEEASGHEMSLGSNFEEGDVLYREGKFAEAEQFFIKAAASNPGDPKVYARLGLLYLQMKNYSDAIESLKVAVKLDKYNPSRYYNLALAYAGNKDTQKAISAVREAITLDPVTQKYRQLLEKLLNG